MIPQCTCSKSSFFHFFMDPTLRYVLISKPNKNSSFVKSFLVIPTNKLTPRHLKKLPHELGLKQARNSYACLCATSNLGLNITFIFLLSFNHMIFEYSTRTMVCTFYIYDNLELHSGFFGLCSLLCLL